MLRNHEQLGVPIRQSESGVRLLQYFLTINWSHIHNPCPVSGLLLQPARGPVAWLGSHLRGCFRSTCPPPPAFLNKQRVQSAAPDQRRRPWSTALTPTAATAAILRLAGGGLTGRHGAIRMSSSILQTRRHSIYCTRRRSCPMLLVVPILRRIEPACTCVCGTALFQGIGLHLAIVAMFSGFGLALQPTAMASRAVVLLTTL